MQRNKNYDITNKIVLLPLLKVVVILRFMIMVVGEVYCYNNDDNIPNKHAKRKTMIKSAASAYP